MSACRKMPMIASSATPLSLRSLIASVWRKSWIRRLPPIPAIFWAAFSSSSRSTRHDPPSWWANTKLPDFRSANPASRPLTAEHMGTTPFVPLGFQE